MSTGGLPGAAARIGLGLVLLAGCQSLPSGADRPAGGQGGQEAGQPLVAEELIVSVRPGADEADLEALFSEEGATVRDRLRELSVVLLGVEPERRDQVRQSLEGSPLVEGVADNHLFDAELLPNDEDYPLQWHLAAIEAPAAWQVTTGSAGVVVAVLDSGVDREHPDLAPRLLAGANTFDGSADWQDAHGHGTAVAGTIAAASNNRAGVASVAWSSPLMPIRVTNDDGQASTWAVAAGIGLAVSQGARVINVSISPVQHEETVLRQARLARLAGALVVFAAGNSGQEVSGGGSDDALFVGAVDREGELAAGSAYGEFVDLVAPGVDIYTTQLGGSYGAWSGTSFAAPIVSGVAALVWSVNPELRPATVQGILLSTATDLGEAGEDGRFGAGQVNARAAVELAQAIVESRDETAPTVAIREPAAGATLGDATLVEVEAGDDGDLAEVTLSLDGVALASDAIAPFVFVVDPAKYAPGEHELSALAEDVFGNAAGERIRVVFAGPPDTVAPTVSVLSPAAGSVLRGVVTVQADAWDDRLLARAEVLLDGKVVGTIAVGGAEARLAYPWNASGPAVAPGAHELGVRVFDAAGNAASAAVRVVVEK